MSRISGGRRTGLVSTSGSICSTRRACRALPRRCSPTWRARSGRARRRRRSILSWPILAADDGAIGGFVAQIYSNLFARLPDAAGLAYWAGRFAPGWCAGSPSARCRSTS
ncbi:MAG: DUF4214 domain-containing protein [Reyranella sp.]|uniref:DUF4214 domain-containing protein n=1 Tax=Reyranella sp. TaxID=1929291 RepID=UPI003D0C91AF